MKNKVIREINKVFDDHQTNLAKNSIEVDKSKLNGLLENLYSPGPSFQYIFDLPSRSFTFVSKGITNLFRENPENFTVESYANRLHPEDFHHFMNCEEIAGYFLFSHIDKKEIPFYKVSYQLRFRDKNDNYRLHLRQAVALSVDKDYNLSTVFANQSDIGHITNHNNYKISFIHIKGGKSYFGITNIEDLCTEQSKLKVSNREIEILKLISEGFRSKEIADYLHISLDTVGTHRKNILAKTNFKNLTQAATHYVREGVI